MILFILESQQHRYHTMTFLFFPLPFVSSCQSYVIDVQVMKTHIFHHPYILIPVFIIFASFTFSVSWIKSSLIHFVSRTLHESALRNLFLGFPYPFLLLLAVLTLIKCRSNLKVLRKGKYPKRVPSQTI